MAEPSSKLHRLLDGLKSGHKAGREPRRLVRHATPTGHRYTPLPTARSVVRLLHLNKGWKSRLSSVLHFEFTTTELSSDDLATEAYYAISYTWGAAPELVPIVLDGKQVLIPDSAEAALRGITDCICKHGEWPMLPIWIDAVCINQDDVTEKQHQIRLMGKLYSKAETVFVWLGLDDGTAEAAFRSFDILAQDQWEFNTAGLAKEECKKRHLPTGVDHHSLLSFLSCPWFTRLWVLQEVALNQSVVFVRGSSHVFRSTFTLGVERLFHASRELSRELHNLAARAFSHSLHQAYTDLDTLLQASFLYQTSNPHDRIYGILGLVDHREGISRIIPEYDKPLVEVYREASWLAISCSKSLSLLTFGQNLVALPEDMLESWPSWVPMYNQSDATAFSSALGQSNGRASSSCEAHVELDSDNANVIRIRGVNVAIVTSLCFRNFADTDCVDDFLKAFWVAEDRRWQPVELSTLAAALVNGWYDGVDATMNANMISDFGNYLLDLREDNVNQSLEETIKDAGGLQGNAERFRSELSDGSWHALVQLGTGTFARTSSLAECGDRICILFGIDNPVVLRPYGDSYKMRGGTYVPGIMTGEHIQKLEDEGRLGTETIDFSIS